MGAMAACPNSSVKESSHLLSRQWLHYIEAMGLAQVLDWVLFRVLAGSVQPNAHDCGTYVFATASLISGGASLP